MSIRVANWDLGVAATEGLTLTHTRNLGYFFLWDTSLVPALSFLLPSKIFFSMSPQNSRSSLCFHFFLSLRFIDSAWPNTSTSSRISAIPDFVQMTCSVFVFLLMPNWTLLLYVHSHNGAIIPSHLFSFWLSVAYHSVLVEMMIISYNVAA